MKKALLILFGVILLFFVSGCEATPLRDVKARNALSPAADALGTLTPLDPNATRQEQLAYYKNAVERADGFVEFSKEDGFYTEDITLTLSAKGAKEIFYTDDGSIPGPSSTSYSRPIQLAVTDATLPRCAVVRAVAYYTDGTKSPVFTHTFFLNTKIKNRFSTPIFSIVAPPDELTYGPDALLVGKRAVDTGEYAYRTVLLQLFLSDGTKALEQPAVLRVYGDVSRSTAVKSLQLIAGTEMEEQLFAYSFFGTSNEQGEAIHYQDLVLSNGESDFQYAFIRDEFAQTLAKQALLQDYEDVQPAVVYINGEYYGLHWMHERYSNDFFQTVYGASAGRYAVIDWNGDSASPLDQADKDAAERFQADYQQILDADLETEEGLAHVQRLMDVENYLDYCALNILIDNAEWPSQMQAYAYIPENGDLQSVQWRFLPHSMSNSFGLKGGKDAAKSDTLGEAMNPESSRYAQLFTKLMGISEYRTYFVEKMTGLLENQWSKDTMLATLKELHNARNSEMQHCFTRIDALRKTRNSGIWMKKKDFETAYSDLTNYVKNRPNAISQQLKQHLPQEQ